VDIVLEMMPIVTAGGFFISLLIFIPAIME
jgi:hypothetical protein